MAGLITAALPSVVDIVATVPVRPVVMALLRVADAVLPPALLPTTVPATPPRSAPPASGPSGAPADDPPPAAPTPPADPVLSPVPAAVPPAPATPPPMPVVGPAPPTTSAGHHAARVGPVAAGAEFSGQPVAPVDQDTAGVGGGSAPGPGLVWPLDRPAQFGAGQPCDVVPLLIEGRNLSPITRPG
ncbi:hypothetical protein [Micromonospora violae]|uniref:hypothetical protein n=1 Tax=Micromonospora violae TaxID=1278207 RepID=UPI0033DB0C6F